MANDVYIPPGHTLLTVLVATNDLDAVRDALALGIHQAFGINSDGDLIPIPPKYWRTPAGRQTLETGEWNWHERWATGGRSDARYEALVVVVANPPSPAPETVPRPEPAPVSASEQIPREPSESPPMALGEPPKLRGTPGRKPKFDRDEVQAYCYRWFDDNGVPDNVSAFCRDNVLPWCAERYDENETPELETLRPYVKKWIDVWVRSNLPPE